MHEGAVDVPALSRGDSERAAALARAVTHQARTAVEDVRRLASGLRPPVLDDLGLLGALRSTGLAALEHGPEVRIVTHGDLGVLPAAVEVAAYCIISEAMTNAFKHADASAVDGELLASADAMTVHVTDDGTGIRMDAVRGTGLTTMRERAAELGGWCGVSPVGRGTRVTALLPVRPA